MVCLRLKWSYWAIQIYEACSGRVLDSGNPDFTSGLFRCCFYGVKYHNIYKKYIFCSVLLTMYIIISISIIISSFSFLVLFLKITRVSNCWVQNRSQIFGCGVELLRQRCPSLVWYESSTSVIFIPRNQAINQIQKCQYTM